ncbi:hypothetical protein PLESTB_000585100 [Pleodorina starrii]|uniref:Uncharacterized protein n=1 Tax=Pleodorina starrii TaxID=330485 RepID=A0A9W6BH48_9CHLO|nr:hypothetical protein PLESTM_000299600 [Pleodorina starrii]GLC52121.1 hypothetical protein PLESTB_000585100 [Pleodorina starrii]
MNGSAGDKFSRREFSSNVHNEDIWSRIADFLDRRDVPAFRASCQLGRRAISASRSWLLFDTTKRPHINWGNVAWLERFLKSFNQLRSIQIRDGRNNSTGFTSIQDACREAAKRAGAELDGFHTSSPHWVHRTIWRLASRQLRSLEMACPSDYPILLFGEQLLQITSAFPLLEELSLHGYRLETNPEQERDGQAAGGENEHDDDDDDEDDDEEDAEEDDDDYGESEGEGDDYAADADEDTGEGNEDGDDGEDAQHEAVEGPPQQLAAAAAAQGPQQPADQQQAAAADQQQEAGEQSQGGVVVNAGLPASLQPDPAPPQPAAAPAPQAAAAAAPGAAAAAGRTPDVQHAGFHPALLTPMRATLTTLRLHCRDDGLHTASEDWALALADLTNLRTLDLAPGMASQWELRAHALGMPVPWTRRVAVAWRAGLRQLTHLSVRLALQCDDIHLHDDMLLPLQTHGLPLPVGGHTTHLGMFIDDYGYEPGARVQLAGLDLLASTLATGCLPRLECLEFSLRAPHWRVGGFGLYAQLATQADSPLARLRELLAIDPATGGAAAARLPRLRCLTLAVDTAAMLTGLLPALVSPPQDGDACGGGSTVAAVATTLVACENFAFTDLLAVMSALRGTPVVLQATEWPSMLLEGMDHGHLVRTLEVLGPHAAMLALPADPSRDDLRDTLQQHMRELCELEVAYDNPHTLPPMDQRQAWHDHLRELDLLGRVGCLTRLGLTLSYRLHEDSRWHGAANVDAHLAAVVRACPQLKALDITITEYERYVDEGERALASWRGAKAAAAAGADLDHWRLAGCHNPVPRLHCLADLPALERLSLELDVMTTQGLSGLVEDEVRMLLETVEKQRSWRRQQRSEGQETDEQAAAAPEHPLSIWCPQLSRDAARRLSRLAAQLTGRGTAAAAAGGGWDGETWLVDCTHRGLYRSIGEGGGGQYTERV